jgi:hypothetical protein
MPTKNPLKRADFLLIVMLSNVKCWSTHDALDEEDDSLAEQGDSDCDNSPQQNLVRSAHFFLIATGGKVLEGGPKDKDYGEHQEKGEHVVNHLVDDEQ